jgi:hypothetical protein
MVRSMPDSARIRAVAPHPIYPFSKIAHDRRIDKIGGGKIRADKARPGTGPTNYLSGLGMGSGTSARGAEDEAGEGIAGGA